MLAAVAVDVVEAQESLVCLAATSAFAAVPVEDPVDDPAMALSFPTTTRFAVLAVSVTHIPAGGAQARRLAVPLVLRDVASVG